jgi:hypothetical protein
VAVRLWLLTAALLRRLPDTIGVQHLRGTRAPLSALPTKTGAEAHLCMGKRQALNDTKEIRANEIHV